MRVNLESITEDSEASESYVRFRLDGKPHGKDRMRYRNAGRYIQGYTPRETKIYEQKAAEEYIRAGGIMIDEPVWVTIISCFQIPKSASKKEQEAMRNYEIVPNSRPDIDNVEKAILDGLRGVAYHDDTQVALELSMRCYADDPGVEVTVQTLPGTRFRRARC